jgi:hypothetical protein
VDNLVHVLMKGLFLTVVIDQVLQHIPRKLIHSRVNGVYFVDDLALENFLEFIIH